MDVYILLHKFVLSECGEVSQNGLFSRWTACDVGMASIGCPYSLCIFCILDHDILDWGLQVII